MNRLIFPLLLLLLSWACTDLAAQVVVYSEDFEACEWRSVAGEADMDVESEWTCDATANYSPGGMESDEDWYISTTFSVEGYESGWLSVFFSNAGNDMGQAFVPVELWYSSDFSGEYTQEAIESATWIMGGELNYDFEKAAFDDFLPAGLMELQWGNSPQLTLAFRYRGDGGEGLTWQIDSLSLSAAYYEAVYDAALSGLRCEELLGVIRSQIRSHISLPYSSGSDFDIWDAFRASDVQGLGLGDPYTVWDMSTDIPAGNDINEFDFEDRDIGVGGNTEGDVYNRDHVFPRAWWGGGNAPRDSMHFDLWNLVPMDKYINAQKASHPLGLVGSANVTGSNGTKVGSSSHAGYGGLVFEPIDEYKGDFARMYLYMAARYGDYMPLWRAEHELTEGVLSGDSFEVYEPWLMELLQSWHEMDSVSAKERRRNEVIYALQGNRNPFVDNPQWVDLVWNTEPCLVNVEEINGTPERIGLFPSPARETIELQMPEGIQIESTAVYDMMGHLVERPCCRSWSVADYAPGQYLVVIYDRKGRRYLQHFWKVR